MDKDKVLLVLHGKQAGNEEVRAAVAAQREAGRELAVRVTWEDGDARRIVEEALAAGYATLVAGGGDGTLREVAEALARGRGEASLAILPLGTANDFARAAGIPLEPAAALALLDQTARPIDLGEVNGKLFLNMATGGFGSKVTANTSEDLKKVLGGAAYLLTGLTRFPKCMPPRAVSAPRTSSGKASSSPWASVTGARPAAGTYCVRKREWTTACWT